MKIGPERIQQLFRLGFAIQLLAVEIERDEMSDCATRAAIREIRDVHCMNILTQTYQDTCLGEKP